MSTRTATIRHHVEETTCDTCGQSLRVGDSAHYDHARGTVYCSRRCADQGAPILRFPTMPDKAA